MALLRGDVLRHEGARLILIFSTLVLGFLMVHSRSLKGKSKQTERALRLGYAPSCRASQVHLPVPLPFVKDMENILEAKQLHAVRASQCDDSTQHSLRLASLAAHRGGLLSRSDLQSDSITCKKANAARHVISADQLLWACANGHSSGSLPLVGEVSVPLQAHDLFVPCGDGPLPGGGEVSVPLVAHDQVTKTCGSSPCSGESSVPIQVHDPIAAMHACEPSPKCGEAAFELCSSVEDFQEPDLAGCSPRSSRVQGLPCAGVEQLYHGEVRPFPLTFAREFVDNYAIKDIQGAPIVLTQEEVKVVRDFTLGLVAARASPSLQDSSFSHVDYGLCSHFILGSEQVDDHPFSAPAVGTANNDGQIPVDTEVYDQDWGEVVADLAEEIEITVHEDVCAPMPASTHGAQSEPKGVNLEPSKVSRAEDTNEIIDNIVQQHSATAALKALEHEIRQFKTAGGDNSSSKMSKRSKRELKALLGRVAPLVSELVSTSVVKFCNTFHSEVFRMFRGERSLAWARLQTQLAVELGKLQLPQAFSNLHELRSRTDEAIEIVFATMRQDPSLSGYGQVSNSNNVWPGQ